MKNKQTRLIRYTTILILCVFFQTTTFAQDRGTHPLIGAWEFDYGPSFARMETSTKTRLDSLPQQKFNMESVYRGRKILFGADGSYVQQLADGRRSTGTWVLDGTNNIVVTDPNGNKYPQRIKALTKTHLVIEPIVSGESRPVLPEWHYKKLKN